MANIMSLKNVRNKASRNGFDLSRRTCFTAKVGELLPVWWKYVLPGDSFQIDLKSFTRTQPVNTASFGRLREYYDFFFVPLDLLWNKSHTVLTQMYDNNQHATGLQSSAKLTENLPSFSSISDMNAYLANVKASAQKSNMFGYDRASLSAKLLSYLGYGQLHTDGDALKTSDGSYPVVSLYPLLAYQKIYADFFRYTQWESPNPSTFNVDWMTGNGDTTLKSASFTDYTGNTMFDLRYCNYQKDLYHGLMPNAQFGETAAVPIGGAGSLSLEKGDALTAIYGLTTGQIPRTTSGAVTDTNLNGLRVPAGNNWTGVDATSIATTSVLKDKFVKDVSFSGGQTSSSLSILALRQAEALQRWKEVAQAAEEDYKQQIQAHWNVNVSDLLSGQCRYLGGHNTNVNINEVVNTNLVNGDASQPADIAGKGVGSLNGQISFNSQGEYGVIMCIYHALPLLDYITSGTDSSLLDVTSTAFPIPEMDSIGMELLPFNSLTNGMNPAGAAKFLGYAPRYIKWKTDYDRCVGGFSTKMQSWILPYTDDSLMMTLLKSPDEGNPNVPDDTLFSYPFFKVNPAIVDPMFAVEADSSVDTDPLLTQAFFQCYVTRNLDTNGLPY